MVIQCVRGLAAGAASNLPGISRGSSQVAVGLRVHGHIKVSFGSRLYLSSAEAFEASSTWKKKKPHANSDARTTPPITKRLVFGIEAGAWGRRQGLRFPAWGAV